MVRFVAVIDQSKDFPATSVAMGKSGTGKTVKSRERAEYYHSRGFCVIALYDWGRFEWLFMNFPNPYKHMWRKYVNNFKKYANINLDDGKSMYRPHGFKTYSHIPFTEDMPNRLPACFKPFRISFQSLSMEEFCVLLGRGLTKTSRDLIEVAWSEKTKKTTFKEFVELVLSYASQGKISVVIGGEEINASIGDMRGFASLIRSLQSLYRTGLICEDDSPYTLDLDVIMKDHEHIHSFSMAFMEDVETAYLVYAFIIRKIRELRRRNPESYPNLFMVVNEAHELCPSEIDHAGQEESLYYMKILLSQPRDIKLWSYLDTQRFMRLNKTIRGGAYTYYIFKSDMVEIDEISERYRLADSVKNAIKKLDVGVCCTVMERPDVPCFYPPPQSMCKEYQDDFFHWWNKYKLPYKRYLFVTPEKIFTIKKVVVENMLSKREQRVLDTQLFSFHRFAMMVWERDKKPVTKEDCLNLHGMDKATFSNYVVTHPLFSYFFETRSGAYNKDFFYPIKREREDYKIKKSSVVPAVPAVVEND